MSATHVWTKEIPIRVISEANRSSEEHWATRRRRINAHQSAALVVPLGLPLPCVVELVRLIGPRGKRMDEHENLPMAFKALVDGIAKRLKVDDADKRVVWKYDQQRAKAHGVRVTITSEIGGRNV